MAVRVFNGSTDELRAGVGTIGPFNTGGGTGGSLLMLVKPLAVVGDDCYMALGHSSPSSLANMSLYAPSSTIATMQWGEDDPGGDTGVGMGVTNGAWQLLGMDKVGGAGNPRMHRSLLSGGGFTHTNAGASVGAATTPAVNRVTFGNFHNGGGNRAMHLAVAAFFNSVLSDGNYESLVTSPTSAQLAALGAAAIWEFNQASVATPVTDITGNGADQTAITGTTVDSSADPAWTYGLVAADPPASFDGLRRTRNPSVRGVGGESPARQARRFS